jgi:hypothetical protein
MKQIDDYPAYLLLCTFQQIVRVNVITVANRDVVFTARSWLTYLASPFSFTEQLATLWSIEV